MGRSNGVPRYPRINYRFMSEDLDFFFQWLVGASTHGGSEAGESFYAASQIEESDVEGWIRAWTALAERVAARGTTSRDGGHSVSARGSFLRAYTYHRAPLLFISPLDEPGRYRRRYEQARAYFRQTAALFDPPVEPIEVPFEGTVLPGYFVRADDTGTPRRTLLMIGGGDTFVEDRYACIGPAATRRGHNVLMVVLGQGILPFEGLTWQADAKSASIRAWAERCEREISHPDARLVVMPQDEGADSHAIGTNLSLMSQVVFDWLDATLAGPERAADRSVQPPVRNERDRPVAERT